jgi:predicted alpha/beta hydrolase family esterase
MNDKAKYILLHGYAGHDLSFWLQWLEVELNKQGKEVVFPAYEDSKLPIIEEWLSVFTKELSDSSYTYTFIAHSMGSLVTLKLIETLDIKINKVILVACPKNEVKDDDEGSLWQKVDGKEREILKSFFEQDMDWELIKSKIPELHFFYSEDDFAVPFEAYHYYKKIFSDANFKIFKNHGHFNRKNDINTLPEVLELI